jgi:hypothetical protein
MKRHYLSEASQTCLLACSYPSARGNNSLHKKETYRTASGFRDSRMHCPASAANSSLMSTSRARAVDIASSNWLACPSRRMMREGDNRASTDVKSDIQPSIIPDAFYSPGAASNVESRRMRRSLVASRVYSKRRSSRSMISELLLDVERGRLCANFRRLRGCRHGISKNEGHITICTRFEILDV